MSQYQFPPPPYSPPMVDHRLWGMPQPHAAGRVAGIWQLILGSLIFLSGTCLMSAIWIVPDDVMMKAIEQQHTQLPPMQNMSPAQVVRMGMSVVSGMAILSGAVLLILTFFVRRGGKVSAIFSIIGIGFIAMILMLNFGSGLLQVASNPQAIVPMALIGGMLALCIMTIVKLVAAVKASGPAQMQAMQQAYYWMMQQQQAAAAGGMGYGYGYGYGQPPGEGGAGPFPPAGQGAVSPGQMPYPPSGPPASFPSSAPPPPTAPLPPPGPPGGDDKV